MPNILLTQRCVRSCPYCFARKHMTESPPDDVMSWENIVYLADLLEAAGERRASLLGGEPTLHPAFNDIVAYFLGRDFGVTVFTSGIMSDAKLEDAQRRFTGLPEDRLTFICNLNDPAQTRTSLAEQESLKRFLRAFTDRIIPGLNIYRTDFELDFLFQAINEYGLRRTFRVGIAHPIVGKKNRFIALEDIDAVIRRLFSYAPVMERLRIKPGLDCGFPMCRFSDAELGWLSRHMGRDYDFGCGPVVDIGPDMSVWSCFPLSGVQKRSLFEFDSLGQVHDHYREFHQKVRTEAGGIYGDCDECKFRDDEICMGGCLAHSLAKFQHEAPLRMGEMYL